MPPDVRMASGVSRWMPRMPVAMGGFDGKIGEMVATDSLIHLSMLARLSSDTKYPALEEPRPVLGVAGRDGGAAGSLRAGSLGLMLSSFARAFSRALPHSRHVFLQVQPNQIGWHCPAVALSPPAGRHGESRKREPG